MLQRVYDAGHVYAGHYEGYYCPRCADFKSDAELIDGNKCPIHLIELEREVEDNWFFRLSTLPGAARAAVTRSSPTGCCRDYRYNEALSFIKQGLQRRLADARADHAGACRCRGTPDQVFYVWFDALLNYYTALTFAREGEDLDRSSGRRPSS